MPVGIELLGQRFGRLVVIGQGESRGHGRRWRCQCDCGQETVVDSGYLQSGRTRSCGCLRREGVTERNYRHGAKQRAGSTREYNSWAAAKQRCENPERAGYEDYGACGIRMCERWRNDFRAFLTDMGLAPWGTTLDRINSDGNYEPGNCRWATKREQNTNRSITHWLQYNGRRQSVAAWCRELGLSSAALLSRLHRGWPVERALSTPRRPPGAGDAELYKQMHFRGRVRSIKAWALEYHHMPMVILGRLRRGWSLEDALTAPRRPRQHGQLYTLEGRTQTLREWAIEAGLPRRVLHDRLKKGWPLRDAMTAPRRTRAQALRDYWVARKATPLDNTDHAPAVS